MNELQMDDISISQGLIKNIDNTINENINIMEVCGTHTMSIYKNGIDKLVNNKINLISGPGCPVCVTATTYIDAAMELLNDPKIIVVTFGDMLRVPGSNTSLAKKRAMGKNVKVIFSPDDLIELSLNYKEKEIVFLAVGFETIAPIYAEIILKAKDKGISNLSFILSLKTMPEVIEYLLNDKSINIQGLLCPGHVCTITGYKEYDYLAKKYNVPMVVSGFKSIEVLSSILKIIQMENEKEYKCINLYSSVVKEEGNILALKKMYTVFEKGNSYWRGLGEIENTGLKIKEEFKEFDAVNRYKLSLKYVEKNNGCLCGSIIKGISKPKDCKFFGTSCTPLNPIGPCMVSNEGTCNNYLRYGMED